jgi:hypothetical protein
MKQLIIVLVAVMVSGCANTHSVIDVDGEDGDVYQRTSPNAVAQIMPDGRTTASYPGMGASASLLDDAGVWSVIPGSSGLMGLTMPGGAKLFANTPQDIEIEGFAITPEPNPGEPFISADRLTMNVSAPTTAQADALKASFAEWGVTTRAEAEAMVEKWKAAGEIVPDVAEVLMALIAAAF